MSNKTVVVFSGGCDSTTLLYHLIDEGHEVKAISVHYGQRHSRELEAAKSITKSLDIEHRVVNLAGLASIFGENALTDQSVDVPYGEYSPENMQVTVVPNRNMILLAVAAGWAIHLNFNAVAFGAHGGQYTPYPDCQPQFAAAMNAATHVCDSSQIRVIAPFVNWDKGDIVRRGLELGVPFEQTWSCYKGGERPCRKCSTCLDRAAAFEKYHVVDPAFAT